MGEVVPVRATVWREGHDAVAATMVVRYHGTANPQLVDDPARPAATEPVPIEDVVSPAARVKPQLITMSAGRTPDMFHGQFVSDSVGLWTFRVDGWGDPIATWRRGVTAKLDAGQGEAELSNDLLIGARLLERAAAGTPRKLRDPRLEAAARLREPGNPFTRAGAALAPEVVGSSSSTRCANCSRAVSNTACGWTGRWPVWFAESVLLPVTGGWDSNGNPVHGDVFATARKQSAAARRQDGFRRGVSAADPPDRQGASQGPQQQRDRRPQRRGLTVGDWERGGRPRRLAPGTRHDRGLR